LLPEVEGKKRVLAVSSPTQVNPVSVLLVCSLARSSGGRVLYMSIDRPNETLSKLVNKHCAGGPSILFPNSYQDPPKVGEASCISGLCAPKLMLEAVGHISAEQGSRTTLVIGNLATLAFYNSNDRIREFMTKLGEKVADESISKLVLVMDRSAQYLYGMAREFCEAEMDLSQ